MPPVKSEYGTHYASLTSQKSRLATVPSRVTCGPTVPTARSSSQFHLRKSELIPSTTLTIPTARTHRNVHSTTVPRIVYSIIDPATSGSKKVGPRRPAAATPNASIRSHVDPCVSIPLSSSITPRVSSPIKRSGAAAASGCASQQNSVADVSKRIDLLQSRNRILEREIVTLRRGLSDSTREVEKRPHVRGGSSSGPQAHRRRPSSAGGADETAKVTRLDFLMARAHEMDQESIFLRRELLRLKNTDQNRLFRHPPADPSVVAAHDKVRKADQQLWQRSQHHKDERTQSPRRSHSYTNGSTMLSSRQQRTQNGLDGTTTASIVSPPFRSTSDDITLTSNGRSMSKSKKGGENEANVSQQQLRALRLVDALRDSILSTSQPQLDDHDFGTKTVETIKKVKRAVKTRKEKAARDVTRMEGLSNDYGNDDNYFEQMRRSYFECSQQILDEIERQLKHNTSHHLKTQ